MLFAITAILIICGCVTEYINYVKCTEKTTECNAASVRGYPSWIINGQLLEGAQSFQTLAKLTGCTY